MIGRVLPGLTTAAALATAVMVVVNPAVPSLPDVQIPALFPTQVDMPAAAAAVTGAAEAAVPGVKAAAQAAVTAAVRSVAAGSLIPSPAALENTVARVATVVVPNPDIAGLMHAARALTVRAAPAGTFAASTRTVAVSQTSALAGTQSDTTRPVLIRPFQIQSGPANVPPPMASVPAGSVPRPTQAAPTPSPKPTRGFGPGANHSPQARQTAP